MGLNYGPIFRRLWIKVHQITSADAEEIVVCNAVFQVSISCSIPEIFASEVRRRTKSRQKARQWVRLNYGPIFRRLWTPSWHHQITSADAGEIVVYNAVFRLSISCILVPFRRHSRSKCEVVRNRAKKHVFRHQIFWGVLQIHLYSPKYGRQR